MPLLVNIKPIPSVCSTSIGFEYSSLASTWFMIYQAILILCRIAVWCSSE
jgi:hypothetical protein